eukprot:2432851-Amphidinium_carterae.1
MRALRFEQAWGYAHIDVSRSFEKARELMTKSSVMTDHGRRVVLEARGALIKRVSAQHLKKHGRLPPVETAGGHPRLEEWFASERARVPLRAHSAGLLLIDKSISLELHDLHFMYDKDVVGQRGKPNNHRRLLVEAWHTPAVYVKALFDDVSANGFRVTEKLFAMAPKERQVTL